MKKTLFTVSAVLMTLFLGACKPAPEFLNQNVTGAGFKTDVALTTADGKSLLLNAPNPEQVTALFFGYTQCPDVCPTTLGTMKLVKQELQKDKIDPSQLRVVFVSLDPERDSPTILKEYMAAFDPSFIGASTDLEHTKKIAHDFGVNFEKVGTGQFYTLNHSANLYLIDRAGRTRVSAVYGTPASNIAYDVRQLLNLKK